jgi:uncharacterized protein YkwD
MELMKIKKGVMYMNTKAISYIISILLGFTGLGLSNNMYKSIDLTNENLINDESQVTEDEEPNNVEVPSDENESPLNNNETTENTTKPPETTENTIQPPTKVTPKTNDETKTPNKSTPGSNSTGVTEAQGDFLARVEEEIFTATNNERVKAGLQPLKRNSTANSYARNKSLEMLNLNYFDHKSPNNGYISDIARKDGWKYSRIGENIYTMTGSSASSASGAAITASWMSSEGHRANILNSGYTDIGIGVAFRNNKLYATQIFYTP